MDVVNRLRSLQDKGIKVEKVLIYYKNKVAIAISYFYNSTHYFHTFLSLTFELHVTVLLLIHMEQVLHPILFKANFKRFN